MGSCPAENMLSVEGSVLPLPNFSSFAPTSHEYGLTAFLPPSGRLVARISVSITAVECYTGGGSISAAADAVFALVFAIPIKDGTGSTEAMAAATSIEQLTLLSRRSTQEADSAASTRSTVFVPFSIGAPAPPSSTTRRRTATATGSDPSL